MSDHSELKRLAEAFPADLDWDSNTEPFFNGPSGESLGGGATGFYSVYGKPFRLEGEDYDYDGPTYVEACHADFAKFMVAAREGVLALIAENERLRMQLVACGVVASSNTREAAERQRDMHPDYMSASCQDVIRAVDREMDLREERDQLKADNEVARMRIKELDLLFGRYILAMRAAVIEENAEKGMEWIYNSLAGPGELPPEEETDAQAYFDREIVAVDNGMQEVLAFHDARRAAKEASQ